jgi:hypothetical protein
MMKSRFWLIPAVLMLCVGCNAPQAPQSGESIAKPKEIDRRLDTFTCISGTAVQIAPILIEKVSGGFSTPGSGYGEGYIYNYAFIDSATGTLTKLLKDNRSVVTTMKQFPGGSNFDSNGRPNPNCDESSTPVKWLTYTIVSQDSNNDKDLTREDKVTIALSDIRGQNYTELIPNVDQVYAQAYRKTPEQLFVVYRQDGKKMLATIDLTKRQVIDTKPVTDLGDDVK